MTPSWLNSPHPLTFYKTVLIHSLRHITDFYQSSIFDTIFPRRCVGCDKPDASICNDCLSQIVLLKDQQCIRCLKITPKGTTCNTCLRHTDVTQILSVAHFNDGPLKEALHTLKYHQRKDIFRSLATVIDAQKSCHGILSNLPKDAVLIPVPLHRRRLWRRGFNQSELIAKHLSQRYNLPISKDLMRRKWTDSQVGLRRFERQQNLTDAFRVTRPTEIHNKAVILVDDIVTTGSTMTACAKAVKSIGVKKIIAFSLARAL